MRIHHYLYLLIVMCCFSCGPREQKISESTTNVSLRDTMLDIIQKNHFYRQAIKQGEATPGTGDQQLQNLYNEAQVQDSINLARIMNILDSYGWPSRKTVGDTAVLAPFFILQGCDDPKIMNKYFPLVQAMVENGEISPRMLAYYTDRLALLKNEPQVFGTQIIRNKKSGEMELYPVISPDSLDIRRKAAELGPVDDYLKAMSADTSESI